MKLIVGLGNPGRPYINSRHNIGFSVIGTLAKKYKIALKKEKNILALSGKGRIGGDCVILAMPLTFMNLSGIAVSGLLKRHRVASADLLVVCDDLDLEFARLRLRPFGSSGGHRGLKSVIDSLGTQEFSRLRVGIGRPAGESADEAEYVLSSFGRNQKIQVKELIAEAADCCAAWVNKGIIDTMNTFNKRSQE